MQSTEEYTLTRFLYPRDEVELSFIHCLLNKINLQEAYFWIFELHFSGFETFSFLWKIYLDFYKEYAPLNLEKYILKKIAFLKNADADKKVTAIAAIVRNLFRFHPSPTVFLLRQLLCMKKDALENIKIIKQKERTAFAILHPHCPKKYLPLFLSIERGYWMNVCHYLQHFLNAEETSFTFISALLGFYSSSENKVEFILKQTNVLHYLLAFCLSLATLSKQRPFRLFITPTKEDLQTIREINDPFSSSQLYNALKFKRLFGIRAQIGCFFLQRYTLPAGAGSLLQDILMHWEYYAVRSPLWKTRLFTIDPAASLDHSCRDIVFSTEDMKESFYELYAYEFDEQPAHILQLSHRDIPYLSLHEWCLQEMCESFVNKTSLYSELFSLFHENFTLY
jgi:hypothetical protein